MDEAPFWSPVQAKILAESVAPSHNWLGGQGGR
ncbi:MAG: hypothetical protein JNK21_07520 [Rhodospirillaceae bacterium]|nr:hypothetical protein [Rhodospirillaceae bacterium]